MTRTEPTDCAVVLPDDPRVVAALETYLAAAEAGELPDRAEFLAQHSDIAGPLAECLSGLEFLRTAAPEVPADAPDRLGEFRLVREVGRGGMGIVYEAVQETLGRRVAVKVLAGVPAGSADSLKRFRHEVRAAALLAHPNIAPVYTVGCDKGSHYFAMRLIDGRSLGELMRDPDGLPDDPRKSAELARQAADALAHAHAAGVVHRDIKPGNLILDDDGRLWLTDFGLAYLPDASRVTRTGAMVGTLKYMSPEQLDPARGVVDHRTDLYGLGATLYELLTRRPATEGDDQWTVIARTLNKEPVPPRTHNPAVPPELETIVLTLLAKDPADRYPTAAALADDLNRFLAGVPVRAKRPGWSERAVRWAGRHRRAVAATAAGVLAAFAAQSVTLYQMYSARKGEAEQTQEAAKQTQEARTAVDDFYTQFGEQRLASEPGAERQLQEFLAKARDYYVRLAARSGGSAEDRLAATTAARRVADIDARFGRTEDALGGYAEARKRFAGLIAERPGWADAIREAAICDVDHGNLLREHGRTAEAGDKYREAADGFRGLVAGGSTDPFDRAALAGVERNQGLLWRDQGKPAEAEVCVRSARAAFARLATEYPDRPAYVAETAGCGHTLGELMADAGRDEDAVREFREAVVLRQRAAALVPIAAPFRRELARTQTALAAALLRRGAVAEADAVATEAVAGRKRLATEFPLTPAYQLDLANALRTAAEVKAVRRPADAAVLCEQAAGLLGPLAKAGVPGAVGELALTRLCAGTMLTGPAAGAALREAADLAARPPADRRTADRCRAALAAWTASHGRAAGGGQ